MDNFDNNRSKNFGPKVFLIIFTLVIVVFAGVGTFFLSASKNMNAVREQHQNKQSGKTTTDNEAVREILPDTFDPKQPRP